MPTVANYVIDAGGGNSILTKINTMTAGGRMTSQHMGAQGYAGANERAGMTVNRFDDARRNLSG